MAIGIGMGIRVETDTGYVHRKSRVGITNFFPVTRDLKLLGLGNWQILWLSALATRWF